MYKIQGHAEGVRFVKVKANISHSLIHFSGDLMNLLSCDLPFHFLSVYLTLCVLRVVITYFKVVPDA